MRQKEKNNSGTIDPRVTYEDESVLVIDKPSGWIVNEAETAKNQLVLQTWISENFRFQISTDKEYRSGIVHRLDKETSGLILVAKSKEAFENLQQQFKERVIEKTYLALVHGKVEPREGKIQASVGRLPWRRDRFGILPGGRESLTDFKVTAYYKNSQGEEFSLVSLYPKTGRTHQIRIHLKYLGYPIIADNFYAGRKTARKDRKWCGRLFLHAYEIAFIHPITRKATLIRSDLPRDLKLVLKTLSLYTS